MTRERDYVTTPVGTVPDWSDRLAQTARSGMARGRSLGLLRFRLLLLIALVVVPVAARWADGIGRVDAFGDGAYQEVPFVTTAAGTLTRSAELFDRPNGGETLTTLAAGSLVDVAGAVNGRSGIWWNEVYWVRVASSAGAREGFVNADTVQLTTGVPRSLEVNGGDLAAMLNEGTSGSVDGTARVDIQWLPDTVVRWNDEIVAAADRHGIDPELLAILVLVESGGDPRAGSHAGARGLTQVMPSTGASIAAERGEGGYTPDVLWQPDAALDYGAYYIAQQLRSFGRADDPDWQYSVELAAAAYNGGPGTVLSGRYPAETQRYVRWVGGMWRERNGSSSATYDAWMAAGGRLLVNAARTKLAYSGGGA